MNSKRRGNITFLISMIIVFTTILFFVFSNNKESVSNTELFINGIKVNDIINIQDKIYLPLEEIVTLMGDKYTRSEKYTIVENADKYVFFDENPYIYQKNGKIGFISVRFYVFGVPIPNDAKIHFNDKGKIYIPAENPIYKCVIRNNGNITKIYIGDITENAENNNIEEKFSQDFKTHEERIDYIQNLGFKKVNNNSAMYNPVNDSIHGAFIGVSKNDQMQTLVTINNWVDEYYPATKDIRIYAEKIFDFYLQGKGNVLVSIIDGFTEKKGERYLQNKFILGGKTLYMKTGKDNGSLYIYIYD